MNAAAKKIADYFLLSKATTQLGLGNMREAELAAAAAISEDRVYRAVQWAVKNNRATVNSVGEVAFL